MSENLTLLVRTNWQLLVLSAWAFTMLGIGVGSVFLQGSANGLALGRAAAVLAATTGLGLLVAVVSRLRRPSAAAPSAAPDPAAAQRTAAQVAQVAQVASLAHAARDAEFRTLADNISQFVWMADKTGSVYWLNRRFLAFVGGHPDRALGWGWMDLFDREQLERMMPGYQAALMSEQDWEETVPLRSATGEVRWFLTRAVPVRDAQGQVLHWLGTHTDITEMRAMQAKLLEVSRRKDEFLATLSHELRNPLAPILNAAQLMHSAGVTASQLDWCSSVIGRHSQHLARLVDDLLDASRLGRGRLELRRQATDLRRVIDTAVEAAQPALREREQVLELRLVDALPMLDADPVRLAQVVTNLLNNACKYTDRGGRIALHAGVQGDRTVIAVKDSGIGLDAADLETVFDMFAQLRSGLARSSGGLGIGLALSKGIVEAHGGTIRVESAGADRGAEFTVELPLAAAMPSREPAPAPTAPTSAAPPDRGEAAGRRVLLADDNRDAADSMAAVLRLLGHDVRTAYDGVEALTAVTEFAPETAVLDIGMPGLNGYEVAQRIRKLPRHAGMGLIALTGWGQTEDRARALEAGFDHHVTKPADPDVLERLISSRGAPS